MEFRRISIDTSRTVKVEMTALETNEDKLLRSSYTSSIGVILHQIITDVAPDPRLQ
jgi:hypothetical protein